MLSVCPKCQHKLFTPQEICPACGIVFAKYFKYHPLKNAEHGSVSDAIITYNTPQEKQFVLNWLYDDVYQNSQGYFIGRCVLLLGLSLWSCWLIVKGMNSQAINESWLHLVNFPFHEAGHIVFRPFGQFITSLGGTLGQLLMPLICMFTLLTKTRDPFGATVAMWWFGENFLDIAPYVNDARAGEMPLLGGNFGHSAPYGFHDWNYLLDESGLLKYDHVLAGLACLLGSLLMLMALGLAILILQRQRQSLNNGQF
ncbi:MAG: zinc ribbon domain-containing protein [Methylococcales bacterium]